MRDKPYQQDIQKYFREYNSIISAKQLNTSTVRTEAVMRSLIKNLKEKNDGAIEFVNKMKESKIINPKEYNQFIRMIACHQEQEKSHYGPYKANQVIEKIKKNDTDSSQEELFQAFKTKATEIELVIDLMDLSYQLDFAENQQRLGPNFIKAKNLINQLVEQMINHYLNPKPIKKSAPSEEEVKTGDKDKKQETKEQESTEGSNVDQLNTYTTKYTFTQTDAWQYVLLCEKDGTNCNDKEIRRLEMLNISANLEGFKKGFHSEGSMLNPKKVDVLNKLIKFEYDSAGRLTRKGQADFAQYIISLIRKKGIFGRIYIDESLYKKYSEMMSHQSKYDLIQQQVNSLIKPNGDIPLKDLRPL